MTNTMTYPTAEKKAKTIPTYLIQSQIRAMLSDGNVRLSAETVTTLNWAVHELLVRAVSRAQNNGRKTVLETKVREIKLKRDDLAKDIAGGALRLYNKIIENKQDRALVTAEKSICTGCHMRLPAHVSCDLKKKSALITCSFCGRILYLLAERHELVH